MKKIIAVLFILGTFGIQAQEAKWLDDVDEAIKVSQETKKPILANFTGSDWCGWCIRLDREVFSKKEFSTWANENVVLLTVDFPKHKKLSPEQKVNNNQLKNAFQVRGFPSVWLFSPGEGENPKQGIKALGKTGYAKGGPEKWIATVAPYLPQK